MSESVFDKFSLDPTSHVLLAGAAVRAERSNQNFNLNTICEQFAILNLIRSGFQPIGDLQGPKVPRYTKVQQDLSSSVIDNSTNFAIHFSGGARICSYIFSEMGTNCTRFRQDIGQTQHSMALFQILHVDTLLCFETRASGVEHRDRIVLFDPCKIRGKEGRNVYFNVSRGPDLLDTFGGKQLCGLEIKLKFQSGRRPRHL